MKVLILASTVPAASDDRVPRFVIDQAHAMCESDSMLSIHILAPHTPSSHTRSWPQVEGHEGRLVQDRFRYAPKRWETLTASGIMPAIARNRLNILLLPLLIWGEYRAAFRYARKARPDVIYAHWFTPQAIVARWVSRRTGIPFGFTTHASDVAVWKRFGPAGRRLVARVVASAGFMTAVSAQTAQKVFDMLSGDALRDARERLHIVPMGVDYAAAVPGPGNPNHVAIISRLVEKKGIRFLIEAWPAVVAAQPSARLTIAGDGPVRAELEAQARRLGLHIEFPGFVVGEAKDALLASAGIIVQPSVVAADGDSDGLPVALLEALARGRIGIASDASGAQDFLVDGKDGFLVPAGDAEALGRAIVRALTLTAAERTRVSAAARRTAESVAWPTIAAVHLSFITACHDGNREHTSHQL